MASFDEQKAAILHEISALVVQLSAEHKTKLVYLCKLFDDFVNAMTAEANRQINDMSEQVAREQERLSHEHKAHADTVTKLNSVREELKLIKAGHDPSKPPSSHHRRTSSPPPPHHRRTSSTGSTHSLHFRHASDPTSILSQFTSSVPLKCSNQWEHFPATVFCEECHDQFCEPCFAYQHSKPSWTNHRVRPISSPDSSIPSINQHTHNHQLLQQQLARIPSGSSTSSASSTSSGPHHHRASSHPTLSCTSSSNSTFPLSAVLHRTPSASSLVSTSGTSPIPPANRMLSVSQMLHSRSSGSLSPARPHSPMRSMRGSESYASDSDREGPKTPTTSTKPLKSPNKSLVKNNQLPEELKNLRHPPLPPQALLPTPLPEASNEGLISKKLAAKSLRSKLKSPKVIPKPSPKIKARSDPLGASKSSQSLASPIKEEQSEEQRASPIKEEQSDEQKDSPSKVKEEQEESKLLPEREQQEAKAKPEPPQKPRVDTQKAAEDAVLKQKEAVAEQKKKEAEAKEAEENRLREQQQEPKQQESKQEPKQQEQEKSEAPSPVEQQKPDQHKGGHTKVSTSFQPTSSQTLLRKQQQQPRPCQSFQQGIFCKAGDKCMFSHALPVITPPTSTLPTPAFNSTDSVLPSSVASTPPSISSTSSPPTTSTASISPTSTLATSTTTNTTTIHVSAFTPSSFSPSPPPYAAPSAQSFPSSMPTPTSSFPAPPYISPPSAFISASHPPASAFPPSPLTATSPAFTASALSSTSVTATTTTTVTTTTATTTTSAPASTTTPATTSATTSTLKSTVPDFVPLPSILNSKPTTAKSGTNSEPPVSASAPPAESENRGSVADVDAVYSSAVTWESFALPKSVMDGIYASSFTKPSEIQAQSIAPILKKKSVIAQAKAGSGKTAAFGIGMIMHASAGGRALCIAPTRELAQQCAVRIKALAKYTQLSVCLVVPEAKTVTEVLAGELTTNVTDPIVVGTPGSVRNMARSSKKFTMFVVDEADKMLDPEEGKRYGGRGGQMGTMREQTLQIKNTLATADCQVLLFSATFSELVVDFSRQLAKNFMTINTDKKVEEYNLQGLKYLSLSCESRGKFKALTECYAIMSISQSVIFANSKQTANKLKADMENEGYTVSILHADIPPAQRDATMEAFRSQSTTVLIATDVFARGIDVKTINVVINYDIPGNGEDYYHRVGRACRFGRKGVAINLIDSQHDRSLLNEIARAHGLDFPILEFDPKTLEHDIKAFLAK